MDGFKTHPVYDDFTLPSIDGEHTHILGGSWISVGNCANIQARFGFRPHFMQYAGIRYVCSENPYVSEVPIIFQRELGMRITEDYTNFDQNVPLVPKPIQNWPSVFGKIAAEAISSFQKERTGKTKVLMAHAGTGRSSIEVLKRCKNLMLHHSDITANFVQVLQDLLKNRKIQWYQQIEGKIEQMHEYLITEEEVDEITSGNEIEYWQADVRHNFKPQLDNYDAIVADI